MDDYKPLNGGAFINVVPVSGASSKPIDVMSHKVTKCKYCEAPIVFVATPRRKMFPVNAHLQPNRLYRIMVSDFHDCLNT
jgi:hypothetical protein